MEKTVILQIGNTDNRLKQKEWSEYVALVNSTVSAFSGQIHFFGGPPNFSPYQNVAWIFNCKEERLGQLKQSLIETKDSYYQDSIAWTEGTTELLED